MVLRRDRGEGKLLDETENLPITWRALANHGVVCIAMRGGPPGYHNSD